MRYLIVSCAIVGLTLAIGCSTTTEVEDPSPWTIDNIHTLIIDPATTGEMHNQFLDIMFRDKEDPQPEFAREAFIAAFEELFQEYDLPATVIAEMIDQFTPAFNGLVDTHAITFPRGSIQDPSVATDYIMGIGAFTESDRTALLGFLTDLANAEKGADALINISEAWITAQACEGITIAASIMSSSASYWADKHEPATGDQVVIADVIGGIVGWWVNPGLGSIIGAGIGSYMATTYMSDVGDH
jgi:hypothetical protein